MEAEQVQVHVGVDPDQVDVGVLIVGDGLEHGDEGHHAYGGDDPPFLGAELALSPRPGGLPA